MKSWFKITKLIFWKKKKVKKNKLTGNTLLFRIWENLGQKNSNNWKPFQSDEK